MTNDGLTAPDDAIRVHETDGVAVVTINNPTRRNALTPESAQRFVVALDAIDSDTNIGAIVVRGEGGSFCSGADLSNLGAAMDDPTSEASYEALGQIYEAFTRLGEMRVPTIAAVRGSAVGAGVNLAMAADIRIVANDARIISGFARLGLHPGGGHLYLLSHAVNREVAAAMSILGQEITGERAAQLGLAWESVDDSLVEERSLSLARVAGADPALSRKATTSLRLTTNSALSWGAAVQTERPAQMWSLRRAGARKNDRTN